MEKIKEFYELRTGRFTSSTIGELASNGRGKEEPGAPFFSRCEKVAAERMFGARVASGSSLATEWGGLAERYVSEVLNKEGVTVGFSDNPIAHPDELLSAWWAGTPDGLGKDCVYEIKCPLSVEGYFALYDCTAESLKSIKREYYWQLVSNCIITNKRYAELVVFYPNREDLEAIRELNRNGSLSYRIEWAEDSTLPCLGEGKEHLNFYRMRFEVTEDDKVFLTERVKKAIDYTNVLLDSKHVI